MLLIATTEGLIRIAGDGESEPEAVLAPKRPIMALTGEGDRWFVGLYRGGVLASGDRGGTWRDVSAGLPVHDVRALANDPREPSVVYAGTEPPALFVSRDSGETWQELEGVRNHPRHVDWRFPVPPFRAHVRTIAFDPRDANVIYVGIEVGSLLKSSDGGRTWEDLEGCGHDIHRVAIHPEAPETVLVTTGLDTKPYHATGRHGLFRSTDAGRSWEAANQGLGDRTYCEDAIAFDPDDPRRVYMATAKGIPPRWASMTALTWGALTGGFVYFVRPSRLRRRSGAEVVFHRSDDGGRTWRAGGAGLPAPLFDMVWTLDASRKNGETVLVLGTTGGDVWEGRAGGETWAKVLSGLPPITHVQAGSHSKEDS
jgi:hypothetical protein